MDARTGPVPGALGAEIQIIEDDAEPVQDVVQGHETLLGDEGPFTVARCTCGWRSYARRSRPRRARAEASDHLLTFGDRPAAR